MMVNKKWRARIDGILTGLLFLAWFLLGWFGGYEFAWKHFAK
jgi:hypothetical protein